MIFPKGSCQVWGSSCKVGPPFWWWSQGYTHRSWRLKPARNRDLINQASFELKIWRTRLSIWRLTLSRPAFSWVCSQLWRRQWHPTPVLLPGKSHGQRSLIGFSPWGREESDMTERLHFHFSLSCIGEGNSNPLQCSCLENPRDGRAWWAAIYGVAQSRTRLKWLSSSSSSRPHVYV